MSHVLRTLAAHGVASPSATCVCLRDVMKEAGREEVGGSGGLTTHGSKHLVTDPWGRCGPWAHCRF